MQSKRIPFSLEIITCWYKTESRRHQFLNKIWVGNVDIWVVLAQGPNPAVCLLFEGRMVCSGPQAIQQFVRNLLTSASDKLASC